MPATDNNALIIVDLQYDFRPGGALAVAGGDDIVDVIIDLAPRFDLVVATRDWHPADHCSFIAQGGIWPEHCVAGTRGALLDPLVEAAADLIVDKATMKDADAYSGFQGTDLAARLRDAGVTAVTVVGLATDYCVKATALDAVAAGFATTVIPEAAAAVNVNPGDEQAAIDEMRQAGVTVEELAEVLR
jgi:nicotinamidase/pyrazinamidase